MSNKEWGYIIQCCSEDTGIDLVLNRPNNEKIVIFDNTERVAKVDTDGNVSLMLAHELDVLTTEDSLTVDTTLEERHLSMLGIMLNKWIKEDCLKINPVIVVKMWQHYDMDMRGNTVDYELDMVENMLKYLVYSLIVSDIDLTKDCKTVLKELDTKIKVFLNFEYDMGCSYCIGYIQALKDSNSADVLLYI